MLKKLLTVALIAATLPMMAQTLVNRRVLIEEFTNASCPPCAAQNPAFNATVAANIDYLTPIKYQTSWPGYDPMHLHNVSEVGVRVDYYGVTGVPNGRQNGSLEVFPMNSYTAAMIQTAYNTLTPVTITLTHNVSDDRDSVYMHVDVKSSTALTGALKLRVAVVEKEIFFPSAPGTNGEAEFYNIMKKMLPDASGTTTGDFAADVPKSYDFAWKLANFYSLNNVEVIAWLQNDDTKEVWQSAYSTANTDFADAGVLLTTKALTACQNTINASVEVLNTSSSPLTSATVQYTLDGGAPQTFQWTGNIAPADYGVINLPAMTVAASGAHNVGAGILNTNNGDQLSQVDVVQVFAANTLYEVVPSPVTEGFQSAVPPAGWGIDNKPYGWAQATVGAAGSNRSARVNFYNLAAGSIVDLYMPQVTISNTGVPKLTYDYAHALYSASYTDTLKIQITTDCGATWNNLLVAAGATLKTAANTTSNYTPGTSHWKNNSIDLSAYAGQDAIIRFRGVSDYGNNLYIDNVNITSVTGVKEIESLSQFAIMPNPASAQTKVAFTLDRAENISLKVFNLEGQLVLSQEMGNLSAGSHVATLDATRLNAGSYRVVLQSATGTAQQQMVVVK